MRDRLLEKRVRRNAGRVKEDLSTLVGDSAVQLSRFENNVTQATDRAREDVTEWVEDGVSQLNEKFEKLTDGARETMSDAAAMAKKDIGHGLSQYNSKAQEIADRVPGGLGQKAAAYPWVAISIGLVIGFLLGILLKPTRYPPEQKPNSFQGEISCCGQSS